MNGDVLLNFLHRGLINVGGDDDKLGRLRKTAVDLAAIVEKEPAKACPFALVAFDPDVSTTDPTIAEVEGALRNRWETYVNTYAATPVTVFRALLLDALIMACAKNDTVAAAFVASARNVLPFMEVGGEREIWADVIEEVENTVEERSEKEWAIPASLSVPDLKFESTSSVELRIASKKAVAANLMPKFEAAAGPHTNNPRGEQKDTDGNQYLPHNDPNNWVHEFGRLSAKAVSEAINRATGSLSVEGLDLPRITEDLSRVMSEHLTNVLQAVSDSTAGLQRRTNLLWWKEALFSPSARKSYREMTPYEASVLMAFDMHRQIPTFSPASIAAFLREAVIALPSIEQERKAPILELFEQTRDADVLSEFRTESGKLVGAPSGRGSILGVIGYSDAMRGINKSEFRELVGVNADTPLTLPDWSVWIFRELQAARAVAEASGTKRQSSRKRTPRK